MSDDKITVINRGLFDRYFLENEPISNKTSDSLGCRNVILKNELSSKY
jgi:hypothetical protein